MNTLKNKETTRNKTRQQKLNHRNKYIGCFTSKYSGPFLNWIREEMKLMTLHKALHLIYDVERTGLAGM